MEVGVHLGDWALARDVDFGLVDRFAVSHWGYIKQMMKSQGKKARTKIWLIYFIVSLKDGKVSVNTIMLSRFIILPALPAPMAHHILFTTFTTQIDKEYIITPDPSCGYPPNFPSSSSTPCTC